MKSSAKNSLRYSRIFTVKSATAGKRRAVCRRTSRRNRSCCNCASNCSKRSPARLTKRRRGFEIAFASLRKVDEGQRTGFREEAGMKCQSCPNPATVHLTDIVDGHKKELHLCETCAEQKQFLK